MAYSVPDDIAARVRHLPPRRQEQALAYVRSLESAEAHGGDPEMLTGFAGSITSTELAEMAAAIEAGCERVDAATAAEAHVRGNGRRWTVRRHPVDTGDDTRSGPASIA